MSIVGHRGARFEAPENTLPGFRYALALGLPAVEFDVRMTADDQLVVIHDETVDRTTNGTGLVSEMSLAEVQRLDARTIFPDWPEPCTVPALAEVFDVLAPVPNLMVEIKSDTAERLDRIVPATVAEILRRDLAGRVTITSFDPYALGLVQRQAPRIRRGYIGNWDTPDFLERAISLGCAQADVHHPTADRDLVAQARAHGLRIICWPTNSREALDSALTFAPDLFCTDRPTLLRELSAATDAAPDAVATGTGVPSP